MLERNEGLTQRLVQTMVGAALLCAGLGPRASRRPRLAVLAAAGCGLGLLAIAVAAAGLGMVLLVAGARVICRMLSILGRGKW